MNLTLPDHIVIARAATLRDEWLTALNELAPETPVTIDAAATTKVDATGMALLLSLFLELGARKSNWTWTEIPAAIADAANDMGVAHHLQPQVH